LHRFGDLAFDISGVAIFGYASCVLFPTEGILNQYIEYGDVIISTISMFIALRRHIVGIESTD